MTSAVSREDLFFVLMFLTAWTGFVGYAVYVRIAEKIEELLHPAPPKKEQP